MAEVDGKWPVLLAVGALVAVPLVIIMLRAKEPPSEEPVGEQISVEFVTL